MSEKIIKQSKTVARSPKYRCGESHVARSRLTDARKNGSKPFECVKKRDFDLIFFHTEEYPFKIVQTACNSNWCHVAIVLLLTKKDISEMRRMWSSLSGTSTLCKNVRGDGILKNECTSAMDVLKEKRCRSDKEEEEEEEKNAKNDPARVYIFESTTDDYQCVVTGKKTNGVKICLLENRLPNGATCGYKQSCGHKNAEIKAKKHVLLYDIIPSLLNVPYEKNLANLVKAWIHWLGCSNYFCGVEKRYDESSMFCTELVTHVFTILGVLKADHEGPLSGSSDYTDEDLVLEDYVYLERDFIENACWLKYKPLVYVDVKSK